MDFRYQKLLIFNHDTNEPLVARPYIPVFLIGDHKQTESPYYALLDSGADRVIFSSDLAKEVGINNFKATDKIEPTMGIGSQSVNVYYHKLKIQVMGDSRNLETEVGFAENFIIPLLGRSFFRHFKSVSFMELKEKIELK